MRSHLILLAGCASGLIFGVSAVGAEGPERISDAQLVHLASSPFDKAAKMGKRDRLGLNHGAIVVADYPCSDLCPAYTMRVIHYDVEPGPACTQVGGVKENIWIPMGIAVGKKPFCIPAAIARTIATTGFQ